MWRCKLGAFCQLLNLNPDNHKAYLKEWFGRNWAYSMRPLIESIKLPEFYNEEESRKSLRAVWVVAVKERERRLHKRPDKLRAKQGETVDDVAPVVHVPSSWIERTLKDD